MWSKWNGALCISVSHVLPLELIIFDPNHFHCYYILFISKKYWLQIQKKLTLGNVVKMKWSPMHQRVPYVAAGTYLAIAMFDLNHFHCYSILFLSWKYRLQNQKKTNIVTCGQNEVEPYASACPACCRCFWWYRSGNNKMTRVFLLDAMRNYVCLWLLCPLLFSPSNLHRVLRIIWIIGNYFEGTRIKHFISSTVKLQAEARVAI